jgi:RNA polymerase sigma-70 factor (ECF subfamily)
MHSLHMWSAGKALEERADGEEDTIRVAQAGDQAALQRLLARHQRSLYTLCRDILGHAEDAEDAVQETFLRALRALPRFRGESSLRTWLFRIATHVCLDWKRARSHGAPLDEAPGLVVYGPSPAATVMNRLHLSEALSALLPRQRAVLLLKEWQGWSIAEIAATLGWKERRVNNELYRARRALADWLQQEERQEAEE